MNTPAFARWILTRLLPAGMRDAVLGDLEEGYRQSASPDKWYLRQAVRSVIPAIRMRWRSPGVLRIGAAAIASYIVVVACVIGADTIVMRLWNLPGLPNMAFAVFVGATGALASGAVMATLVPMAQMRAVKIFAAFLALMGLLSAANDYGTVPLWVSIALLVTGPACALLGGFIASRSKPSRMA